MKTTITVFLKHLSMQIYSLDVDLSFDTVLKCTDKQSMIPLTDSITLTTI